MIIDRSEAWCEGRCICFHAEANYNQLNPDSHLRGFLVLTAGGTLLGSGDNYYENFIINNFTNTILAGLLPTEHGMLLVKNPQDHPDHPLGRRNALGLYDGVPAFFYSKDGSNWKYGRPAKLAGDELLEEQEALELSNILGYELLLPSEGTSEVELESYLQELGFDVTPGISIWQLLSNDCLLAELGYLAHNENNPMALAVLDAYAENLLSNVS